MDAIKLNTLNNIAVSMAKVFGIGITLTDFYEYKNKIIYVNISRSDKTMSLVDAKTKETIGSPVDISNLPGSSFYRYVEPITELIRANLG